MISNSVAPGEHAESVPRSLKGGTETNIATVECNQDIDASFSYCKDTNQSSLDERQAIYLTVMKAV